MTQFKDALEIFHDETKSYQPPMTHFNVGTISLEEFNTIRLALRIAQAVTEEPSKQMILAGGTAVENSIDETRDSFECYIYDEHIVAYNAFRAMIEQMMKEIDNG